MITVYESKDSCCGCGACSNACPKECIIMKADTEGFLYPQIDKSKCVNSGKCRKVCPFLGKKNEPAVQISYAAISNNDADRQKSSSGGVFALFAKTIIKDSGVVVGTRMSQDFKTAEVIAIEDVNELEELMRSKYVQSNTRKIYQVVKRYLDANRKVLFTGTPCQVTGLKNYLGKDYNELFCVEIICHGVPSPKLWKKYVEHMEVRYNAHMTRVNFRCKDKSWREFGINETYGDKAYFALKEADPYMQMFLKNYSLRESCYSCKIKGHSDADITVGDFWGIEDCLPNMNDGKGTSLIIVKTKKGNILLEQIKGLCNLEKCDYFKAIRKNSAEVHSVPKPQCRDEFFADMNQMSFHRLTKKYIEPRLVQRIKQVAKKILRGGLTEKHNNSHYGILLYFKSN